MKVNIQFHFIETFLFHSFSFAGSTHCCCFSVDNLSSTHSHSHSQTVPPDILDYPTSTDMVVREGSNVTLKCAARGSPQPNITWRRESGESIAIGGQREGKIENCNFHQIHRWDFSHKYTFTNTFKFLINDFILFDFLRRLLHSLHHSSI